MAGCPFCLSLGLYLLSKPVSHSCWYCVGYGDFLPRLAVPTVAFPLCGECRSAAVVYAGGKRAMLRHHGPSLSASSMLLQAWATVCAEFERAGGCADASLLRLAHLYGAVALSALCQGSVTNNYIIGVVYWPQFYPRACPGCANIWWCHGSLLVGVAPAPSNSWYRADRERLDSDRNGRRHEGLAQSAARKQPANRKFGRRAPYHDPRIDCEVATENDQQVARHEPDIRQHIIR